MVKKEKYMRWIDKFNQGIFQIYAGQTIEGFQPLDFFHFFPMWYDLWIEQIILVMDTLNLDHKSYQELKGLLSTPSNIRAILQKIMPSWRAFPVKNPTSCRRVTNFFARMLEEACPEDPFAENASPCHTAREINNLHTTVPWSVADPGLAKIYGRLITAAGSLVHGLYNDVVTDYGWDTYGPYQFDRGIMLIRHFPDCQAPELWGAQFRATVKEILMYGYYEDVEWKIAGVGCHTIVKKGSPVTGLKKYAVLADGRALNVSEIEALTTELAAKAEMIYRDIRTKDFEELKKMVMLQECFQLKKLFDAAGIDWRPTAEMLARIKDKPLLTGLIPPGKMVTSVEEYKEMFGINIFAREVFDA